MFPAFQARCSSQTQTKACGDFVARVACSIAGVRLRYALKDTAIMLVPMLLVLAALIIWPSVSLFLPRLIVPEMLK